MSSPKKQVGEAMDGMHHPAALRAATYGCYIGSIQGYRQLRLAISVMRSVNEFFGKLDKRSIYMSSKPFFDAVKRAKVCHRPALNSRVPCMQHA